MRCIDYKCGALLKSDVGTFPIIMLAIASVASPETGRFRRTARTAFEVLAPGAFAGALSAVFANPLDVIKTRLQSASSTGHVGSEIVRSFRSTGFRGFFVGLPASLLSLVPTRAFYFGSYNGMLRLSSGYIDSEVTRIALAAGTTAVAINLIFSPIFLIRTLQFLAPAAAGRKISIPDCARMVMRAAGPRGFWLGLTPSLVGVGETVGFWILYEHLKQSSIFQRRDSGSQIVRVLQWTASVLGATAIARFVCTIAWYPHEVLRTRMREPVVQIAKGIEFRPLRFQDACKDLYRGGRQAAFAGLSVHLARQVPTAMVTWLAYEAMKNHITKPK